MRFAIDAHAVGQHLTGNEVYVRNLLDRLGVIDDPSNLLAYVCDDPSVPELPSGIEKRIIAKDPFLRLGFDFPRLLRQDRPDVLHVQYTGPLFCSVPLIVSVHDVSFLEHPEFFSRARRLQLAVTVKRTVKQAQRVLCPSEFSRKSILRAYDIDPQKVLVMPNAVSGMFRSGRRDEAAQRIAQRFGIRAPFVLSVGDLQPRKNHLGLLKAFVDLQKSVPNLPHHLVFVGKDTWFSPQVRHEVAASGLADRVHITGFVEDAELIDFYQACEVAAYPSFYEGFGLPILEAMACGRAVACSNTTAMPEVASGAALLFDPNRIREIAMSLRDLLMNADLRQRMERLGLQRAAQFSWHRTASQTLDVYYEVAGRERPVKPVRRDPVSASSR